MDYREILKQELAQRQATNVQYSMRAFARDLGVDPGQLSNVIQGKKNISLLNAATMAHRLTDHPTRAQLFYHSVEYTLAKTEAVRLDIKKKITKLASQKITRVSNISDEEFESLSKWYHLPLMQLALLKSISIKEGAAYFGVSENETMLALERLRRMGFMEKRAGLFRRLKALTTTTDVPSLAIRQFHLQMLEKARQALFRQSVQKRYFSSVTLRVPQTQLDDYKKIINDAEEKLIELSKKYETEEATEVYYFSSQLFSLKREDYDA